MKKILIHIFIIISKAILPLFYDKQYLKGRWFEKSYKFDVNDLNNFQHFGCYFQNYDAKIIIGKGTYISLNVGIITAQRIMI